MKRLLLLFLVLSSCAPVYVPNIRNSPMFAKGGEFQIAGQIGNGFDGQAALSITNHIGVMANYSYIDRTSADLYNTNDDDDYLRHKFFEGGIGYFENTDKMFMEIFAGYGRGEGNNSGTWLGIEAASGKYERYFIQPAFGFNKRVMHVSFVPRIAIVDFTEFTNGSTTLQVDESPRVFFEPGVVGRLNAIENRFYFTFQAGISISTGDLYFDHREFQFGTGIGFRIGGVGRDEQTNR